MDPNKLKELEKANRYLRQVEINTRRVRQLQKEYFRTRSTEILILSKTAERNLDHLLESGVGL